MNFLGNILPTTPDRWKLNDAVFSGNTIIIFPGGSAVCRLEPQADLSYIPEAFEVRLRQEHTTTWQKPTAYIRLKIVYEDSNVLDSVTGIYPSYYIDPYYTVDNVVYTTSRRYTYLEYILENPYTDNMTCPLYELRPSADFSDALSGELEYLIPQIVRTYNESVIEIPANDTIETVILNADLSVNDTTNVLALFHYTGITNQDTIITTWLRADGVTEIGFPTQHNITAGVFTIAIPSACFGFSKGAHSVSVHVSSDAGALTISNEKAVLILEGKNILSRAIGTENYVNEFTQVPTSLFLGKFDVDSEFSSQILERMPDANIDSSNVPYNMFTDKINVTDNALYELRRFGRVFDFSFLREPQPIIEPINDFPYEYTYQGLQATTHYEFMPIRTDYIEDGYSVAETIITAETLIKANISVVPTIVQKEEGE